ncbi:MAG TPA: ATP-binding cassette domain-containing protein, partial [Niallia sp.]|nr:ATP-binding cassette domain-containing protein [Niallia sp.]
MIEILKLKNISYEILDSTLLENIHASVQRGDVIGIIGKNGAGKSTLLQMIAGELQPTKGQCMWLQSNVETSIVEQETQNFSTLDVPAHEATLLSKWKVPTSNFSVLSGGEKLKIRLAKGFSKNAQLLLLDEPTNHLDEKSTKLLMEQIKQYKGTVILISHDRYFLDQVTTKIWSIENKKLYEHKGNYTSYMKAREQRRLTQQREFEKQQKMVERIETQ